MSLLHEIRRQPLHIRKLMFGLSVITTLSLGGMIWFHSFQSNMYALLNPGEVNPEDERFYADVEKKTQSPFVFLKDTFVGAGASILGIFGRDGTTEEGDVSSTPWPSSVKPRALPLSDPR